MRLLFAWALVVLPCAAQEPAAPIAPVEPVPLPTDLDFDGIEGATPARPQSVTLRFAAGADYQKQTQTLTSRGALEARADTGLTLRADGGRYLGASRQLILVGAVKLRTETGTEVFADRAILDDAAQSVEMLGNVSIFQGNTLQRGQRVVYRIQDQQFEALGLRTGMDPILLEAGAFRAEERDGRQVYVGRDAGVTTHDVADPQFWLRADETVVYPDERVTFRNLKIYAGDTPIFWLPYISQPLDGESGYQFVPGARTNWGPFLLNSYGILLGEGSENRDPWLFSRWHVDLRSRRGLAAGLDLRDRRQDDREAIDGLSLYYAQDLDPTITRTGLSRPFITENRWRARLRHRLPLAFEPGADWRLDSNIYALSDAFFLEDFDPQGLRDDPAPDNTLGLFRTDDDSLFGVLARLRPNDAYRAESRFELSYDQARRPLFGTSILHEGQTSLGILRERIGQPSSTAIRAILDPTTTQSQRQRLFVQLPPYEQQLVRQIQAGGPGQPSLRTQLVEPGYARVHTYQELSRPIHVGRWLNLTPEVGIGYTRYAAVEGPSDSLGRLHFYAGAEASVKFTRDFDGFQSRRWGLDGLRHIAQPYARYSFVNTDDLDRLFPAIDREDFTTRPRPLTPGRFTAIDSLRDWSILRLGMRHRLITRRDGQSFDWLFLDSYIDGFFNDPDFDRNVSNFYNDLSWQPLPWLAVQLETQMPLIDGGSGFSEVVSRLQFMPNPNVELSLGSRYLNNHPVLVDSTRLDFQGYVRLNDRWGVGSNVVWELDDGTIELQQYTLHRDFNHWVASLGLSTRDNRLQKEYGVLFSISLKNFPSAFLPLSLDS